MFFLHIVPRNVLDIITTVLGIVVIITVRPDIDLVVMTGRGVGKAPHVRLGVDW